MDNFYEIHLMEFLINNFHTFYSIYTYCMPSEQISEFQDWANQLVQLWKQWQDWCRSKDASHYI